MTKKIWKGIWYLLIAGIISMSAFTILTATYISCFILFVSLYVIVALKVISLLYNLFKKEERERDAINYTINWWQTLIIASISLIFIWWFRILSNLWIIQMICEKVALRCATHISLPWWWIPIQINLN